VGSNKTKSRKCIYPDIQIKHIPGHIEKSSPLITQDGTLCLCVSKAFLLLKNHSSNYNSQTGAMSVPTEEAFQSMTKLVVLLGHFQTTTEALCAEETPTVHWVRNFVKREKVVTVLISEIGLKVHTLN
jgi:hypothetical protein